MSEHEAQVTVIDWAAWHEGQHPELGLLFAIPNGGHRHVKVAVMLKAEGVKAGIPDLMLACARQGWHGLFIELKIGSNKPSAAQLKRLAALTEQGYLAVVCWGADEAIDVIKDYLGMGAG